MPNMIKRKIHILISFSTHPIYVCCFILVGLCTSTCFAIKLTPLPLLRGYLKIKAVSEFDLSTYSIPKEQQKKAIEDFCNKLRKEFKRYSWEQAPCNEVEWQSDLKTELGHPLLYTSFGTGSNTTLILGGVHPDELTPIPLAFRLARHLKNNPLIYKDKEIHVIIAPLVNPDGFLKQYPTRTNASEVDLNRNFLTLDWYTEALQKWSLQKKPSRRFFPGYFPNSEIETLFQNRLLDRYQVGKILSIHAPLGFYDYDGPGDNLTKPLHPFEEKAKFLVRKVSEKSKNYRIVDYSVYPGSLGNFAGKQRRVPTLTLELETTNPKLVDVYWEKFLPGFLQSIQFDYTLKTATRAIPYGS
jgi:protein MpaA